MLQRAITRAPRWALVVGVLSVVAAGLAALAVFAGGVLPARTGPPVEELTVERTVLSPSVIALDLRNVGADPVAIAQISVNDSFVDFEGPTGPIPRLGSATVSLDYPWQDGLPYRIGLLTSTGLVIEHEIPVAVSTPAVDLDSITRMVLIGVLIGIVPVLLGMAALPLLRRSSPRLGRLLLAVTVGLLGFLALDAALDGVEVAGAGGGAFGGPALVVLGAGLAFLALSAVAHLTRREARGARLALLIAIGIGLHNLGEGLAVGSAYAIGELALGAALVVGFAMHNTTEGIAVVAPLAQHPVSAARLLGLAMVAGAPASIGTVLGATATTPTQAALLLGVGVGAIIQVIAQIVPLLRREDGSAMDAPVLAGLATGVLVMYATGLLVAA